MADPADLYTVFADPALRRPVLLYGLNGFVDAGRAVRRARLHLFEELEHEVIARFDVDELIDYRSWRPQIRFEEDHYAEYQAPSIELSMVQDEAGVPFLFLAGREPDLRWEVFVEAVEQLVRRFDVGLCVELHAIPMSVPHTRPTAFTAHGIRTDLVEAVHSWKHSVQIPASAGALLEYRLGHAGHQTFGLAAHVPQYLAEGEYPAAAAALLDTVGRVCDLSLPTEDLHELAAEARKHIDEQVAESTDLTEMVSGLEQQYDSWANDDATTPLAEIAADLPTADELGEQFARFLAEHDERHDD